MYHKINIIILIISLMLLENSTFVNAEMLEKYKNILENGNYTIKYDIVSVFPQEKIIFDTITEKGKEYEAIPVNDWRNDSIFSKFLSSRPQGGVIVVNGENKYYELAYKGGEFARIYYSNGKSQKPYIQKVEGMSDCYLNKSGEKFYFTRTDYKGKQYYVGGTSSKEGKELGKIEVGKSISNAEEALEQEANYGSKYIARIIAAINPMLRKSIIEYVPEYKYVCKGEKKEGTVYEDYSADEKNGFYVIRYEYKEGKLDRVLYSAYKKNEEGKIVSYSTEILKIKEFTSEVDISYLNLPSELKIVKTQN